MCRPIKPTGKQIAIIGAGISGLLACKHAMENGFSPIVFEARSCIGGVWAHTIESTKLQTPKNYYQFSDLPWPASVTEAFPDHNQLMSYIQSYSVEFNLLPRIKFNHKVVAIDYCGPPDEDMTSWDLWGGNGGPFSPVGKWNITVQDTQQPFVAPQGRQVYEADFVVLCNGNYSDLPNMPKFRLGKGPEVFGGRVIHSMDFSEMDSKKAADFIKDRRVTIVGFQKSAIDIAAEVSELNGVKHPCTLLFKTVYWTVPEHLNELNFKKLNRFSEFLIHKPHEGFFFWLLAIVLSPLLWLFSTLMETYLKWIYPLKKYNMVPKHKFLAQVSSCMVPVLPPNFYQRVEEGSLVLKKSTSFYFCKNGLIVDKMEAEPLETDVVIFATGYKSDEKFGSVFKSSYFKNCIVESTAPFYRECIHPRIPQLAILGYSESPANLFTTEMRSKWLAHFLAGKFKLPTIREMEEDVLKWEKCMRRYAYKSYKRSCISVLLQIYCNDQLCRDMGCNPRRKKWFLSELFAPYSPLDYTNLSQQAKQVCTISKP